jgi:hypothetical protein
MPSWPSFTYEFASSNPPEEVHRSVVKLAPTVEGVGYTLRNHSDESATFSRRYVPGGAIAGGLLAWALAAYGYSSTQNDLAGGVAPGVYILAVIAVVCLFIRRSEELQMTFEAREGGTVVLMNGHAKPELQEQFRRRFSDGTIQPDQLPPRRSLEAEVSDPGSDALSKLKRLAELRDAGALSDSEFDAKKAELLDQV